MSLNLVPQPESITESNSAPFRLDSSTVIAADGDARDVGWLLHDYLRAGTGLPVPVLPDTQAPAIRLELDGERPDDFSAAADSYQLTVDASGVRLTAAHSAGLARGVQTLRQLLPSHTLRSTPTRLDNIDIPAVDIVDTPRFAWRGVMIDVARHFKPKSFVLRMIDLAALHRFSVVHLHLTDDQGWRLEVPGWPKLTEVSSWRTETVVGHSHTADQYDGTPHGGYYTTDDLREIVAFAAARHITVVPEIDLPGHVRSVLAAYPELGNTGDVKPVATTFGIFSEVLAPSEAALGFAKDVFDTVVDIFPSPFIHIGGDEVPRTEWRESEAAHARADELGLSGPEAIQAWFTAQFAAHLAGHGRSIIGWDEILDGGAPQDAVISVWRDFAIASKAAERGHRVIVAPVQATYLDYYESMLPEEPLRIFKHIPVETIANFEPLPEGVADDRIFGVQAQLWSEYMKEPGDMEYSAFPRLAAIADMAWAGPQQRTEAPVAERLPRHVERLDAIGVNYRPLDGPKPWQQGGTGARRRFDWDPSQHERVADLPD